ncbi:hypothetical protein tb265_44950 [Gemmatimonadetes bacterium T265]|nr:hypothetical protein tb265_44950 [Gemmatimonadetes bacterium T265]
MAGSRGDAGLLSTACSDRRGPSELTYAYPHGRSEAVTDAWHLVWLDQPDACARFVTEFLA